MKTHTQHGGALMVLFIAIALFGLLAFAFMQGTRSNIGFIDSERDRATAAQSQDCLNAINMATKRLRAKGCGTAISYEEDGTNPYPGAPTDGSCSIYHVNGGGAKACVAIGDPSCDIAALGLGESCQNIMYAGSLSGTRLYTTLNEGPSLTWNNGSSVNFDLSAYSQADGEANTDILIAATGSGGYPFAAAEYCRSLGVKWYLPSHDEAYVLCGNKADIGGFSGEVWTSTQEHYGAHNAMLISQYCALAPDAQNSLPVVRCVRKD